MTCARLVPIYQWVIKIYESYAIKGREMHNVGPLQNKDGCQKHICCTGGRTGIDILHNWGDPVVKEATQKKRSSGGDKSNIKQRRFWARPWLLRRPEYGHFEKLMAELAAEDQEGFCNFQRIDHEIFHELLTRIGPRITKQDTFMRKALSARFCLVITMRFLATGDSYKSLEYKFRVANNSLCRIVPETCEAIIAELAPEVFSPPIYSGRVDVRKQRFFRTLELPQYYRGLRWESHRY